jgi:predicted dehydrogenase
MRAAVLSASMGGAHMIDAGIVGLGRWGKAIVEAVQGKSQKLRFVRGVSKEPDGVRAFAQAKNFTLSTEFKDILDDPAVRAVVLATPHSLHVDQVTSAPRQCNII